MYATNDEVPKACVFDYNLLFRWFVGLNMDDAVWHVTVYTKNRERLLQADVANQFFALVVAEAQRLNLMSDEHFTVDGTLLEACASLKSFQKVDARSVGVAPATLMRWQKLPEFQAYRDAPLCPRL